MTGFLGLSLCFENTASSSVLTSFHALGAIVLGPVVPPPMFGEIFANTFPSYIQSIDRLSLATIIIAAAVASHLH